MGQAKQDGVIVESSVINTLPGDPILYFQPLHYLIFKLMLKQRNTLNLLHSVSDLLAKIPDFPNDENPKQLYSIT